MTTTPDSDATAIAALERPHRTLLTYYIFASLLTGPLFPFFMIPRYFRYYTLRYRFDEEGVAMGWGILFRREISLTYARIQDIHLASNVAERWLGLARVKIQTASGAAEAEMTIEGLREYDLVRDFLYQRMRGMKRAPGAAAQAPGPRPPTESAGPVGAGGDGLGAADGSGGELAAALRDVADELRAVRTALETLTDRQGDRGKMGTP